MFADGSIESYTKKENTSLWKSSVKSLKNHLAESRA